MGWSISELLRAGLVCGAVIDGVLVAQEACRGSYPAFGSWRVVRQPPVLRPAGRLQDGAIDES